MHKFWNEDPDEYSYGNLVGKKEGCFENDEDGKYYEHCKEVDYKAVLICKMFEEYTSVANVGKGSDIIAMFEAIIAQLLKRGVPKGLLVASVLEACYDKDLQVLEQ